MVPGRHHAVVTAMLVLRRTEGQWVEVRHRSGDQVRFRVYGIKRGPGWALGQVHLAFDDAARNFEIQRSERAERLRKGAA